MTITIMSEKFAGNVKRSVKEVLDAIPREAPVAITLVDDERIKSQYRGATLHGFWLGISPNQDVHDAIRSPLQGDHWYAHVVDVRSDQLLYDLRLDTVESIDVSPTKVAKERER
jgi:hypothetical protein